SLTTALEMCGAKVAAVASAAGALQAIGVFKPPLLGSGIWMPHAEGYELICRVRGPGAGRRGNIPAGGRNPPARIEDRMRALSAGYQMHVAKPVEPMELITIIASLMGRTAPSGQGVIPNLRAGKPFFPK